MNNTYFYYNLKKKLQIKKVGFNINDCIFI